jgi:SAM-dependent methyltransferase
MPLFSLPTPSSPRSSRSTGGQPDTVVGASRTEFNAEQFANPYPDGIQYHYWTLARNELVLRMLRKEMTDPAAKVLDVGCGRGITVEHLRRHAINAIGADTGTPKPIVPEVAPYLYLGQGVLTLPIALRKQVQTVLLLDVLEHLPAPAEFVAGLLDAFQACGDIVITVPARQELWSNYDEYYRHYRRYDLTTTRELYPTELLEMTDVRYAFRLLYLPALALSVTKAGRSVSIAAPSPISRPVHRILAKYFQMESALLPDWIVGTSLLMTLRRRELR